MRNVVYSVPVVFSAEAMKNLYSAFYTITAILLTIETNWLIVCILNWRLERLAIYN